MLQFYKLDEAARMLGISADDLKRMAQQGEIHYFTDKGTMRFRAQEIEELARRRGRGSDPELQIGDPGSGVKKAGGEAAEDESVQIGQEVSSGSGGKKSGSGSKGSKPGSKSPPPKPSSDSDVRLVADGSELEFQVADDSARRAKEQSKAGKQESGVRILPLEVQSDSDVKIVPEPEDSNVVISGPGKKTGSDSDIRVMPEQGGKSGSSVRMKGKPAGDAEFVTEEIDLDAEEARLRHSESSQRLSKKPTKAPKSDKKSTEESSSDFELTPASAKDQSPLDLGSDEEVSLGETKGAAGDSGINLKDPADSGISLEQSGSEEALDFELSDEGIPATPKPGPAKKEDSSSEFELSLDADGSSGEQAAAPSPADSDSEFELTLEDSGLMPLDEKAAKKGAAKGEEDIFETDFEVPALDEDSGSEAVALDESDTDLESSDFDLALDEQDAASDEESGSEVVALEDEEEAEAGASTVARPRKKPAVREEEEIEEEEEMAAVGAVAAAPAEWGVLPALVLIPSVLIMFFVTLVGFEMVRGTTGYRTGSTVAAPVAHFLANDVFQQNVP